MKLYFDASALVPMYLAERGTPAMDALFESDSSIAPVVSTLAKAEFASAVSRRVRMGQLDPEEADISLGLFDDWTASDVTEIAVEDGDIARAGRIVRNYTLKLLTPDAIHVGLCQRHELALVTLDARLAEAARALGVEAIMPF